MNPEVHHKQLIGQKIKATLGHAIEDDLLDLDSEPEHFGAWSRNAMVPFRKKPLGKARHRAEEPQRRH